TRQRRLQSEGPADPGTLSSEGVDHVWKRQGFPPRRDRKQMRGWSEKRGRKSSDIRENRLHPSQMYIRYRISPFSLMKIAYVFFAALFAAPALGQTNTDLPNDFLSKDFHRQRRELVRKKL